MSVLIKGMEMPNNCENCPAFEEVFDEKCRITGKSVNPHWSCLLQNDVYPRPDWCPLIEVPDGHGRLIDANALFEEIYKAWDITADASDCNVLMQLINDAPTIIPADKEET